MAMLYVKIIVNIFVFLLINDINYIVDINRSEESTVKNINRIGSEHCDGYVDCFKGFEKLILELELMDNNFTTFISSTALNIKQKINNYRQRLFQQEGTINVVSTSEKPSSKEKEYASLYLNADVKLDQYNTSIISIDNSKNFCQDQSVSELSRIISTISFHKNTLLSWLNIIDIRNKNDMIEVGFEESDLKSNGLYPSGNSPELTSNPYNIYEGKQSLRICLDKIASPIEYRTEFILDPELYNNKFIELEYDKEYWVGFALLLDESYRIPRLGDIFFQIHGRPDLILGEDYRNPALALALSGDLENNKYHVNKSHWVISIIGDDRTITPAEGDRYPTNHVEAISPAENDIGYWLTWVLHFKNTYKPDGFVEIWKNGEKVFYQDNIRTTFNDVRGSYLKLGTYKWSWRNKHDYPVINPAFRISYIDSLRVAQGANRYNDVVPVASNSSSTVN